MGQIVRKDFQEYSNDMNTTIATAGNNERSDCLVLLEQASSGGIQLELQSKVKTLYGNAIHSLCMEVLNFYGIEHAILKIDDKGALPWVMAARLEAVIKQLYATDKTFLPAMHPENNCTTAKEKRRTSRLFLPGNTPHLMLNAGIHRPCAIILDLEDAVAADKKDEARLLVRNALRQLDFMGAEKMVRINQLPKGLDDLDVIVPHQVNLIMLPKCESASEVYEVNERIKIIQDAAGQIYNIWLMPIIESAMGVMKALEIAQAADNIAAMAIGLEDYTADIGAPRTIEGNESFFARSQILNACKAAGIQAIDSVFSDLSDMDALTQTALRSKAMGFDGMGCIHPRQIKVIETSFAPTDNEIEWAFKVVNAFEEARIKGLGVVSVGTKMIDAPVVKRAQHCLDMAIAMGKISTKQIRPSSR